MRFTAAVGVPWAGITATLKMKITIKFTSIGFIINSGPIVLSQWSRIQALNMFTVMDFYRIFAVVIVLLIENFFKVVGVICKNI